MKKIYIILFIFLSLFLINNIFAQNVNVDVTMYVTLTGHSEYGSTGGNCQESGDEEYSGKVWFWTDVDGTWRGGSCRQCTSNGN